MLLAGQRRTLPYVYRSRAPSRAVTANRRIALPDVIPAVTQIPQVPGCLTERFR